MSNRKNTKTQQGFAETCSGIISGTISFFIFILVLVFPLIYHDSYFDILETKYKCYYLCVIGMLAVVLILAMVMMLIDGKEYRWMHTREVLGRLAPKCWKPTFHFADGAVLLFWLIALISTFQSDYFYESFWGNEGRYTGLFLITLYVAFYFLVSRCWKVRGWLLEVFLISGLVICYIGITDYFQLDILNFRGKINPEQSTIFTSTLGNINTYTAYVALIMGFAAAMFSTVQSKVKMLWYYVCLVVSFFAIIMGCSDNAYLALGALFGFLPFVLFGSWSGILRYLIMTASLFTVVQCIDWINYVYADMVIGLDSLFRVIAGFGGLPVVVSALWILVSAFYFYVKKKGKLGQETGKMPVRLWATLMILAFAAVFLALFDANVLGNGNRYGMLGDYLVFSDSWGTNRGYIWRKSLEMYQDFQGSHKLFGYGPDTFGILTTNEIKYDMIEATNQVFDNAHNEYLNLLLTIGPIGVIAYIAFVVTGVAAMCRNWKEYPWMIGCAVAVICYSAQALVNLNLPIATPIMWLMMSAGMTAARKLPLKNKEE